MKKFIIRGSCFVAIGLMLLVALNYFYTRTNGFKGIDDTYKLYNVPGSIEVANLGSSHGEYGFDYSKVEGLIGFNFALPGQNFYMDLQILRKYSEALSDGCLVIIPISYFSFDQAEDHNNQHTLYYRILDYGSITNHNPIEYVRFRLLPILSAHFNIKYLVRDKKSIEFFLIPSFLGTNVDEFTYYAQRSYKYYKDVMEEGGHREFNLRTLEKIIAYCQQAGYKPVLTTTPFTRYYNEEFSENFYTAFHDTIAGISEQYGVLYLDYSHDPRFTEALELFVDSDHMNVNGRTMFTRILLGDLGVLQEATNQ